MLLIKYTTTYLNDIEVASHEDLIDEKQTVIVKEPKIKTKAADSVTGSRKVKISEKMTLIDTITYDNLIKGLEYKAIGTLMDPTTKKPLMEGGKPSTVTKTFKADKDSGEVEVPFTFDGTKLKTDKVVVFEKVYFGDTLIGSHEDYEDQHQTIILEHPDKPEKPGEPKQPGEPGHPRQPQTPGEFIESVATGDHAPLLGLLIVMVISAGAGIFMLYRNRKK